MTLIQYPEHEKVKAIQSKSQIIGEFLEWLSDEKQLLLCWYRGEVRDYDIYVPTDLNREKLLAQYFDIDLDKLEEEKRQAIRVLTGS